jgi:hypothetical protein
MWPYLIGAAAAGVAIGRRRYLKKKEEEELKNIQLLEATAKISRVRQIIDLISPDCWRKALEKGLIPDHDSQLAWEFFKYEYLPKDNEPDLSNKHICDAIRKEICLSVREIDSKYDIDHRTPTLAKLITRLKHRFEDNPKETAAIYRDLCETLEVTYTQGNALSICLQLLNDPVARKGLFGCACDVIEQDQILKLRLAESVKNELNLNDRKLIGELRRFRLKFYHINSGVYESIIIEKIRKGDHGSISQGEAAKWLLDSDAFWDDLLANCTYWRKNTKNGMLLRIRWDQFIQSQILSEISQALDQESLLVQGASTKAFLEKFLSQLSNTYAWNLHNSKPDPQGILLTQIRDMLNGPEFDESLSHDCSIRLSWDENLRVRLSYQIRGRVLKSYSIAYAEEEKLSHTLSGTEYEKLCGKILSEIGWSIKHTKISNDQGVDLLATRGSIILCIQCKRHKAPVGNDAVQAIFAGKTFYSATHACVVTTSGYTKAAKELAASTNVTLLRTKDLYSIHKKISG